MIATLAPPKAPRMSHTTTESPPATHQQTWREWMPAGAPAPALLSHDGFLAALKAQGTPVTAATLESWRKRGVIPRPVRVLHNGHTRPTYPMWLLPAIAHLRKLQAAGKSLTEIAPMMRDWAMTTTTTDALVHEATSAYIEALAALSRYAERMTPDAIAVQVSFLDAAGTPIPQGTKTHPLNRESDGIVNLWEVD